MAKETQPKPQPQGAAAPEHLHVDLDLRQRLQQATANVQALTAQLDQLEAQANAVRTTRTKWLGVVEYLGSLERDERAKAAQQASPGGDMPAGASANGHTPQKGA